MLMDLESLIEKKTSKLTEKEIGVHGMTSVRIRHLLNNLVNMDGARYLEVGVWKGATFVSALYENDLEYACAVDDFSAGGYDEFINNTAGLKYDLLIGDAYEANPEENINIYFYDAGKTLEEVRKGLEYYYPCY